MDHLISTDPFWTTIIEYLDYKDIYHLSIVNKDFDQTIGVKKMLLRKINKGLNLTFGDKEDKIKRILIDFNCYLTGKFMDQLFRDSEKYHDSIFVLVTDNLKCIQEVSELFKLKFQTSNSSCYYALYDATTYFYFGKKLTCVLLSQPIDQTHYIRYEKPMILNELFTKHNVLVNYAKLIY